MDVVSGPVIGVLAGSGGIGASSFAATLAAVAARDRECVLIDLEPVSGGIDVLLGIEDEPGVRWSGLRLDGGRLDPQLLADGLPRWASAAVLAADTVPEPDAVSQLIGVARELGPVVVDLGRFASPSRQAAVELCSLIVVMARSDVAGVTAARSVVASARPGSCGVLVRRTPGGARPAQVARLLDVPLIGALPAIGPSTEGLSADALPRGPVRVARGVLTGVGDV